MNKHVIVNSICASLLIVSSSLFALGFFKHSAFKNNWYERFDLDDGHFITHTPTEVNLDDRIIVGKCLIINGVNLCTNSTREEFVAGLCALGMSPFGISC